MSAPVTISSGLPIVDQALEPKWVRDGSSTTQKAYESALGFEDALVEQLSKSLTESSGLTGAGGSEESSEEGGLAGGTGDSELSSLLPQSLTSSVIGAGGLGLAAQMTRELEGAAAQASAGAQGAGAQAGTGKQAQASGGARTP